MAKLWAKVNGTWVSLGAQSKDDVGLGNVENFTHTNSATDGSSSKYATGAAAKQAYDRASAALSKANQSLQVGKVQLSPSKEWAISDGYDRWPSRNDAVMLEKQGGKAMAAYMELAIGRNDTLLTGAHRSKYGRLGIRVRVYYRRIV